MPILLTVELGRDRNLEFSEAMPNQTGNPLDKVERPVDSTLECSGDGGLQLQSSRGIPLVTINNCRIDLN